MYLVFSKKSFLDIGPIWNYDLTRSCCQLENDGEDDDDDDDDDNIVYDGSDDDDLLFS